jgi:hypothetical protein
MTEEQQGVPGEIDGIDIGVLLGVYKQNHHTSYRNDIGISVNYPAYFGPIDGWVCYEVRALDKSDLTRRLERLSENGYLCHHKSGKEEWEEESWFITRNGLSMVKYGIWPEERRLLQEE